MGGPSLNVASYDKWEAAALKASTALMLEAFSPITFLSSGVPVRVSTDTELIRMVDIIHMISGEHYYQRAFPLSLDEADLVNDIGDCVCDLTKRAFG